jgi:adenylate kinase family enzyme
MDMHMGQPDWNYVGDEATVAIIKEAAQRDRWIIEGYIEKEAREVLFDSADTILYLDYPAWLPALRYIKRWWTHRKDPRPELPGCPEKFSFEFLIRVYKKEEVYRLEQLFNSGKWDNKIIRFKTPKEAEQFLQSL